MKTTPLNAVQTRALNTVRSVGRAAIDTRDDVRGLRWTFTRTLYGTFTGRCERDMLVRQLYHIGNKSLVFVAVTLGFLGMVLVFQTCLQVNKITGDLSQIGSDWVRILVHEFGPTLTAMMMATRVGAGIAAELGSMQVTEQVDALRMCGVDPIDYLVVPRFLAHIIMSVVISIFAVVVAMAVGTLTAYLSFHVNPRTFFDIEKVQSGDVILGLLKCMAYGAAIPVVSSYCGLGARGGSQGVGAATTRAVIGSSFAVLVLDFFLSGLGYRFLQHNGS
jgi:phospholipid/cholesterol/gamma-HCH transport system permease protein